LEHFLAVAIVTSRKNSQVAIVTTNRTVDLFDAMTSVSTQSRIFRVVIVTILPLVPPGGVLESCFKQKWLPIWQKVRIFDISTVKSAVIQWQKNNAVNLSMGVIVACNDIVLKHVENVLKKVFCTDMMSL